MKAYRGVVVQLHSFLTSADEWWSASCPGCFTPGTQWTGGWVGLMASLGSLEKRKISSCCQDLNSGLSSLLPSHSTDWAIPSRLSLSVKFLSYFYELYKYLLCRLTEFRPSTSVCLSVCLRSKGRHITTNHTKVYYLSVFILCVCACMRGHACMCVQ